MQEAENSENLLMRGKNKMTLQANLEYPSKDGAKMLVSVKKNNKLTQELLNNLVILGSI